MLDYIRQRSGSIFIKALFFLLILSFVAWGITGFSGMQLGGGPRVAEVGDVKITPQQLNAEYMRELNRLHMIFGRSISQEEAKAYGVMDGVLGKVVSETLFDLSAKDLGVIISDAAVRDAIMSDQRFQGANGTFDRTRFQEFLQFMGYSEIGYTEIRRHELARWQVAGTVGAGAEAPKALIDSIYRFRNEKRTAKVFKVADSAIADIPTPTEEQLKKFHTDFAAQFTAPEYRKLTVVRLDASDLAKEMEVSDTDIKDAYQQRESEFNLPERREIRQILVPVDQRDKIEKIAAKIAEGGDFVATGTEIAGAGAVNDIGLVSRDHLLTELADAAFALPQGKVSGIIESPLGLHLLQVTKIEPARVKTLDEVRDQLVAALSKDKAIDGLFNLANRMEDTLGGGATLEEAAAQLNLPIQTIAAIDSTGRDPDGKPVGDLPPGDKFLSTAFDTESGMDSLMTEAGPEGYFVVRVDSVTPSALRPLDSVREAVTAAWIARERADKAKEKAEALAKRAAADEPMDALAATVGATIRDTKPFRRADADAQHGLPQQMVTELFAAKVGEAMTARVADGYLVARLTDVVDTAPGTDPDGVAAIGTQVSSALRNDLRSSFARALEAEYGVRIDEKTLNDML